MRQAVERSGAIVRLCTQRPFFSGPDYVWTPQSVASTSIAVEYGRIAVLGAMSQYRST